MVEGVGADELEVVGEGFVPCSDRVLELAEVCEQFVGYPPSAEAGELTVESDLRDSYLTGTLGHGLAEQ